MEYVRGCRIEWNGSEWVTLDAGDGLPLSAPTYTDIVNAIRLIDMGRLRRHSL